MYLRYRYRDLPRASVHGAPKGTVASLRTSSMLGMRYIFISRVGYLQFKFRRAVEQISISKLWYGPPALLKVKVQPPCAYCRLSIQCLLLLCVPWDILSHPHSASHTTGPTKHENERFVTGSREVVMCWLVIWKPRGSQAIVVRRRRLRYGTVLCCTVQYTRRVHLALPVKHAGRRRKWGIRCHF